MTAQRAHLTIELPSAWRIGTGAGVPGGVDASVQRDIDGLPSIPGKTLTGLLSERATVIASWLSKADGVDWHAVRDAVFGTGGTDDKAAAALSVRPALLAISDADRAAAVCVTTARISTANDRAGGTALTGSMRLREQVNGGHRCVAPITLDSALLAQRKCKLAHAEQLLAHAAKLTTSIGAQRRRGLGVAKPTVGEFAPLKRQPLSQPTTPPDRRVDEDVWRAVDLEVAALTPLLLASQLIGNERTSDQAAPGTYLLPIVAQALRAAGADRSAVDRAISTGRLIVTFAVPSVELPGVGSMRTLPTPSLLRTEKNAPSLAAGGVAESLWAVQDDDPDAPRRRLKSHPAAWITPPQRDDSGALMTTAPVIAMSDHAHAIIDGGRQRPTVASGGLHTTRALPARTVLRCAVRWHADLLNVTAEAVAEQLHGLEAAIGESSKDDYGHALLAARAEALAPAEGQEERADVALLLRSPALVRDARLTWSPDANALLAAIRKQLDRPDLVIARDGKGRPQAAVEATRIAGWVRAWQRPRPTLIGAARGSCIVLTSEDDTPILAEEIKRLELEGIGERRAEGFGEVVSAPWLLTRDALHSTASAQPNATLRPAAQRIAPGNGDLLTAIYIPTESRTSVTAAAHVDRATAVVRANNPARRHELGFHSGAELSASNAGQLVRRIQRWSRDEDPKAREAEISGWLGKLVNRERCSSEIRAAVDRELAALSASTDAEAATQRAMLAAEYEEVVRRWRRDHASKRVEVAA
ncbi:MAG: hypothetical protein QM679_06665 [Patulibacter sp.]